MLAMLLVLAMLSTASISALAFAVSADDIADTAYVENVYEPAVNTDEEEAVGKVPDSATDAEEASNAVANDVVTYESATDAEAANSADDAEDAASVAVSTDSIVNTDGYIEIEPATVSPGDTVAIVVDGTDANDLGFLTLEGAFAASSPGDTIRFLTNVDWTWGTTFGPHALTLDFAGFNLTASSAIWITNPLTINNGGTITINASGAGSQGIAIADAGPVIISANQIVSTQSGITVLGASNVAINSNITNQWRGIDARDTSVVTMNGNITTVGSGGQPLNRNGIMAQGSAQVTMTGTITVEARSATNLVNGGATGILAIGSSQVTLAGTINASDPSSARGAIGAASGNSAWIQITGDILAPAGTSTFVGFNDGGLIDGNLWMPWENITTQTRAQNDAVSERAGFDQWSANAARIWISAQGGQEPGPLTAVVTAPSGTVPITTNQVIITFDRAVNPASLGTVMLTGTTGATLNMAGATWNSDFTVLTIPLSGLVAGGSYSVIAQGFVAADEGIMEAPAIGNFNVPDPSIDPGPDPDPDLDPDPRPPEPPSPPSEPGNEGSLGPGTAGTGDQDRRPAADGTAPKTGDTTNATLWIIALIASMISVGTGLFGQRRGRHSRAS